MPVSISRRRLGYRRGPSDHYRWAVACLDDAGRLTVVNSLSSEEAEDLEEQITELAKAWAMAHKTDRRE